MSKKDKKKNKKRDFNLHTREGQIADLKKRMAPKDIAEAEKLAADALWHDTIRLAYRLLPKADKKGLSKREAATYEELLAINPKVAEEYKSKRLTGKTIAA